MPAGMRMNRRGLWRGCLTRIHALGIIRGRCASIRGRRASIGGRYVPVCERHAVGASNRGRAATTQIRTARSRRVVIVPHRGKKNSVLQGRGATVVVCKARIISCGGAPVLCPRTGSTFWGVPL
jgi:hypothetical protein